MSIKSIVALLVFLALGVFLFMNRDKVMSYFKGGMGQGQTMPQVQDMQEDIMIEEDTMPDMES